MFEQFVPLGGALAAVVVASAIALRWLVPAIDAQKRGLEQLNTQNRICEYRLNSLIEALQKQGIAVPAEAWGFPPDLLEKLGS